MRSKLLKKADSGLDPKLVAIGEKFQIPVVDENAVLDDVFIDNAIDDNIKTKLLFDASIGAGVFVKITDVAGASGAVWLHVSVIEALAAELPKLREIDQSVQASGLAP